MKFTGVALALAAFAAGAASQSLSGLPDCATSCATDSIPKDCGLDAKCICNAKSFIEGVSCCVAKACSPEDQDTTLKFADKLCAGVGVTDLPTSVVCSQGASATGTQAAQTASATGTQTAASAATTTATTATAASPSGTNAAVSFNKADGRVTAGVMAAAVFAAMCLA